MPLVLAYVPRGVFTDADFDHLGGEIERSVAEQMSPPAAHLKPSAVEVLFVEYLRAPSSSKSVVVLFIYAYPTEDRMGSLDVRMPSIAQLVGRMVPARLVPDGMEPASALFRGAPEDHWSSP